MTNLDSILKSRDITLPTKVHLVKAMVFPVVMHGCESWTVKKAELWRTDAFELWCWRRLLRSNQSILKEISPGLSLEGMMLKLKLQYFGHLMQRVDSLEKTLMLGGIRGRRRTGRQRMRWLDGIMDSMGREFEWTPGVGDGQGGLACCDSWVHKESDTTATELNWMTNNVESLFMCLFAFYISSLVKYLFRYFAHLLELDCLFSYSWVLRIFYIFLIWFSSVTQSCSKYMICKYS